MPGEGAAAAAAPCPPAPAARCRCPLHTRPAWRGASPPLGRASRRHHAVARSRRPGWARCHGCRRRLVCGLQTPASARASRSAPMPTSWACTRPPASFSSAQPRSVPAASRRRRPHPLGVDRPQRRPAGRRRRRRRRPPAQRTRRLSCSASLSPSPARGCCSCLCHARRRHAHDAARVGAFELSLVAGPHRPAAGQRVHLPPGLCAPSTGPAAAGGGIHPTVRGKLPLAGGRATIACGWPVARQL